MSSLPTWIEQLTESVIEHIQPVDLMAPIGCHVFHNPELNEWEVTLFAARTEVVGGQFDGKITSSKFVLDLQKLSELFSTVTRIQWQSHSIDQDDELGPNVSVEGMYNGHQVWLRILADSPERFETGRYVHSEELRVHNVW